MNTKIIILIVLSTITISCLSQQKQINDEINVLFVGNSLTYYNDMPQILHKIFETENLKFKIVQSAYPGISLTHHLYRKIKLTEKGTDLSPLGLNDTSETVKLVQSKKWNYIILQDGTVRLLIPEVKSLLVIPAIQNFIKLNNNNKTEFVLFKTWPILDTFPMRYCYPSSIVDASINKENCCSSLMQSYEDEANTINMAYDTVALSTKINSVPITNCYLDILKNHPDINLYQDGSHPSKLGAYLNACVFYKYFTKQKAIKIKYKAGINKHTIKIIHQVVDKYL